MGPLMPGGDIGLKDFNCFRQLPIWSVSIAAGLGPNDDVGNGAVELHVFPVVRKEPAAEREA